MPKLPISQVSESISKSMVTQSGRQLPTRVVQRVIKSPEFKQALEAEGEINAHRLQRKLITQKGEVTTQQGKRIWGAARKHRVAVPRYGMVRMALSQRRKSPISFVQGISKEVKAEEKKLQEEGEHKTDLETIEERRLRRLNKRATIIENVRRRLPIHQRITEIRKLRDDAYEPGDPEDIVKRAKNPAEDQETAKKKLVVSTPIEGTEEYLSDPGGGAPLQEASRPKNSELDIKPSQSPKPDTGGLEDLSGSKEAPAPHSTDIEDLEIG